MISSPAAQYQSQKEVTIPTLSPQHKSAMQKGRDRAVKEARKAAIKRVKDYRAWLERDVQVTQRLRAGESVRRPTMPAIPSDNDYKIAREEGIPSLTHARTVEGTS